MLPQSEKRLKEIRESVKYKIYRITDALKSVNIGIEQNDAAYFKSAREYMKNYDLYLNDIDNEIVVTLATIGAEAAVLRELVAFLKITNEISRIAANARRLAKRAESYALSGAFEELKPYAIRLGKCAIAAAEIAADAIEGEGREKGEIYRKIAIEEQKSDDIYALFEKKALDMIGERERLDIKYFKRLSAMRNLEKITDRFRAIAALIEYAKNGGKINL